MQQAAVGKAGSQQTEQQPGAKPQRAAVKRKTADTEPTEEPPTPGGSKRRQRAGTANTADKGAPEPSARAQKVTSTLAEPKGPSTSAPAPTAPPTTDPSATDPTAIFEHAKREKQFMLPGDFNKDRSVWAMFRKSPTTVTIPGVTKWTFNEVCGPVVGEKAAGGGLSTNYLCVTLCM
jgi:hypothetical protein